MKALPLKAIALALSLAATSAFGAGAPFEQTELDRTLPNVPEKAVSQTASSGAWANDHNFISPTL
jgi:hypothetical protein